MPRLPKPDVIPPPRPGPRFGSGAHILDDESLDLLAHVLDDWFRIPGTSIRFGLDGIIGLVPGIGDVVTGIASGVIVLAGWIRGVPYVALLRMLANLAIDVLIGSIPLLGDAFDIAWKANRRNYALLTRHLAEPRKHTWRDWLFLSLLGFALTTLLIAPILVLLWIIVRLRHYFAR
ncbi:MAG: DUF4112 domain-containing protein [Acidobacteriaceae bacterium]